MIRIIVSLAFGGLCGFIAGKIMKTQFSVLKCIILGLIGGAVGSVLFWILGFKPVSIISDIIVSVIGSCIVVDVAKKISK